MISYVDSNEHSAKGYADDATLIYLEGDSCYCFISAKAREIGLLLNPSKCVSLLYDGSKFLRDGISLLGGSYYTRSIVDGPTKFLGKLIDVSVYILLKSQLVSV